MIRQKNEETANLKIRQNSSSLFQSLFLVDKELIPRSSLLRKYLPQLYLHGSLSIASMCSSVASDSDVAREFEEIPDPSFRAGSGTAIF